MGGYCVCCALHIRFSIITLDGRILYLTNAATIRQLLQEHPTQIQAVLKVEKKR
jgi:hypothetical protein